MFDLRQRLQQGIDPTTGLLPKTSNIQEDTSNAIASGADRLVDIQDQQALNQSGWEAAGNSVIQLGANILGEVVAAPGNFSALWQEPEQLENGLSGAFIKAGEFLKESAADAFPILTTSTDEGLQWSDIHNPKFWANTVAQFGPTIALMGVGMGAANVATKGLMSVMKNASPSMAKQIRIAEKLLNGQKTGSKKAVNIASDIQNLERTMGVTAATLTSRAVESGMEAHQAYEQIYNTLIQDGKTVEEAGKLASEGAASVYRNNWALALMDLAQFDMLYKGPSILGNLGAGSKALSATKRYGSQAISEGFEEGVQYAFTNEAEAKAVGRKTSLDEYIGDNQFWESIVQGALGGVVFQGLGDLANKVLNTKQQADSKLEDTNQTVKELQELDTEEEKVEFLEKKQKEIPEYDSYIEREEFPDVAEKKAKQRQKVKEISKDITNPKIQKKFENELLKLEGAKEKQNSEISKVNKNLEAIFNEIESQENLDTSKEEFDRLAMSIAVSKSNNLKDPTVNTFLTKKLESMGEGILNMSKLGPFKKEVETEADRLVKAFKNAFELDTKISELKSNPKKFEKQENEKLESGFDIDSFRETLEEAAKLDPSINVKNVMDLVIETAMDNPDTAEQSVNQLIGMMDSVNNALKKLKTKQQTNPEVTPSSTRKAAISSGATSKEAEEISNLETEEDRKKALDKLEVDVIKIDSNFDPNAYTITRDFQYEKNEDGSLKKKDGKPILKRNPDTGELIPADDNSLPEATAHLHREYRNKYADEIQTAFLEAQPAQTTQIEIEAKKAEITELENKRKEAKQSLKDKNSYVWDFDGRATFGNVIFYGKDHGQTKISQNKDGTPTTMKKGSIQSSIFTTEELQKAANNEDVNVVNQLAKEVDAKYDAELKVLKQQSQQSSPETYKTNSGIITINPDGSMNYKNGDLVVDESVKNKALVEQANAKGTLRKGKYNNVEYSVLPDNRVINKNGQEKFTSEAIRKGFQKQSGIDLNATVKPSSTQASYDPSKPKGYTNPETGAPQFVLVHYQNKNKNYPERIVLGVVSSTRMAKAGIEIDAYKEAVLAGKKVQFKVKASRGRINTNDNLDNPVKVGFIGVSQVGRDGEVGLILPNVFKDENGKLVPKNEEVKGDKSPIFIKVKGIDTVNSFYHVIDTPQGFLIASLKMAKAKDVPSVVKEIDKLLEKPGVISDTLIQLLEMDPKGFVEVMLEGVQVAKPGEDSKILSKEKFRELILEKRVNVKFSKLNRYKIQKGINSEVRDMLRSNVNQENYVIGKNYTIDGIKEADIQQVIDTVPQTNPDGFAPGFGDTMLAQLESDKKVTKTLEQGIAWLKKTFPNIPVTVLNDLTEVVGTNALGAFYKAAVYLNKNAPSTTAYHEAMHVMTELFLSDKQRKQVLSKARLAYNKKYPNNKISEKDLLNDLLNQRANTPLYSKEVNYSLKAVDVLQSKKAEQVFEKGKKNGWSLDKILTELQVPTEQKQIILDKYKGKAFEQEFNSKGISLSEETAIGWRTINLKGKNIGRIKTQQYDRRKKEFTLSIEIFEDYQNKGYGQIAHTLLADKIKEEYDGTLYSDLQNSKSELNTLEALVRKGKAKKIGSIGKNSKDYPDTFTSEEYAYEIFPSDKTDLREEIITSLLADNAQVREVKRNNQNNISQKQQFQKDRKENLQTANLSYLEEVLNTLSNKFGLPYEIIFDENNPNKGYVDVVTYNQPTIVINASKATSDTPLHEYGHIFINLIKSSNKNLYSSLIKEILNTKEGKKELYAVKKHYINYTLEEQIEETIVQLLGEYAAGNLDSKTGLHKTIKKIWNNILEFLSKAFNIKIKDIHPNTSIEDLAKLLSNPNVNFNQNSFIKDNIDKIIEQNLKQKENLEKEYSDFNKIKNPSVIKQEDFVIVTNKKEFQTFENELNTFINNLKNYSKKQLLIDINNIKSSIKTFEQRDNFNYKAYPLLTKFLPFIHPNLNTALWLLNDEQEKGRLENRIKISLEFLEEPLENIKKDILNGYTISKKIGIKVPNFYKVSSKNNEFNTVEKIKNDFEKKLSELETLIKNPEKSDSYYSRTSEFTLEDDTYNVKGKFSNGDISISFSSEKYSMKDVNKGLFFKVLPKVIDSISYMFSDLEYNTISFTPISGESSKGRNLRLKGYNIFAKRLFGQFSVIAENENTTVIPIPEAFKNVVHIKENMYQKEREYKNSVNYKLSLIQALERFINPPQGKRFKKYGERKGIERKTIRLNTKKRPNLETNLRKNLYGKGVTKQQVDLLIDYMKENNLKEAKVKDLIKSIKDKYSFVVEVNTAKENKAKNVNAGYLLDDDSSFQDPFTEEYTGVPNEYYVRDYNGNIVESFTNKEEAEKRIEELNESSTDIPTQHYSHLSALGATKGKNKYEDNPDWEYQEVEFQTPDITPSIKGHAAFSTNNGIGWARIWYNKKTGVVEVQEVQSDLFQKGRDRKVLTNSYIKNLPEEFLKGSNYTGINYFKSNNKYYKEFLGTKFQDIEEISFNEYSAAYYTLIEDNKIKDNGNNFLQLLNKKGNWVNFFIQSIVQDSVKKGYNKILFPKGDTASKIEGHQTVEEFRKFKENRIKFLQNESGNFTLIDRLGNNLGKFETKAEVQSKIKSEYLVDYKIINLEDTRNKEIETLKKEIKRVEEEGFGALKPIWDFYENRISNILKKLYNTKDITDEFGNEWTEIDLLDSKVKNKILLKESAKQSQDTSLDSVTRLLEFLAEEFEDYKVRMDNNVTTGPLLKRLGAKIIQFFKKIYYSLKALLTDSMSIEQLQFNLATGNVKQHKSMVSGTLLYQLSDLKDELLTGSPPGVPAATRLREASDIVLFYINQVALINKVPLAEVYDYKNGAKYMSQVLTMMDNFVDPSNPQLGNSLQVITNAFRNRYEEFNEVLKPKLKARGIRFKIINEDLEEVLEQVAVGNSTAAWEKASLNPKQSASTRVKALFYGSPIKGQRTSFGTNKFYDPRHVFNKFLETTQESTNVTQMINKLLDSPNELMQRFGNILETKGTHDSLTTAVFKLAQQRRVHPILINKSNADVWQALNANNNQNYITLLNSIKEELDNEGAYENLLEGDSLIEFLNNAGIYLDTYDNLKPISLKSTNGTVLYKNVKSLTREILDITPNLYQSIYRVNKKAKYSHRIMSFIYHQRQRIKNNELNHLYSSDPIFSNLTIEDIKTIVSDPLYEIDHIKEEGIVKEYDQMSPGDLMKSMLASFFNFRDSTIKDGGLIPLPIMGDGHTLIATAFRSSSLEEIKERLISWYLAEGERIKQNKNGNIKYNKANSIRHLIPEGKTPMAAVENYLQKEVDAFIKQAEVNNVDLTKYKDKLDIFVAQTILTQIDNTLIYTGDLANFKVKDGSVEADFFKRFKHVYSPATYGNKDALVYRGKDGSEGKDVSAFKVQYYEDDPTKTKDLELLAEVNKKVQEILGDKPLGNKVKVGEDKNGNPIYKYYATVQDGQAIIDPFASLMREVLMGFEDMPQSKEEFMKWFRTSTYKIYKPFFFGLYNEEGLVTPIQHKNSEITLDPYFALENPAMQTILEKFGWTFKNGRIDFDFEGRINGLILEDSKYIDMWAPQSSIKIGNIKDGTRWLNMRDWRLQMETPEHYGARSKNKLAIQLKKLIINDLPKTFKFKGETITREKFIEKYNDLLNKKTNRLYEEVKQIFENPGILKSKVLDQMEQNDVPIEIREAFRTNQLSINDPVISMIAEPIYTSIIRNKVTKQEVPGDSLYNISPYLFKKKPQIIIEGDKVIMEAWIPAIHPALRKYNGREVNYKDLPEGLQEMLFYRIPTEDKYSMFVIRPIGVLPKTMGPGIVLPAEAPDISGFDFDIDKLFGFKYEVDQDGNKIEDSLDNEILDMMIAAKAATPKEGLQAGGADSLIDFADKYILNNDEVAAKLGISKVETVFGPTTATLIIERLLTGSSNIGSAANANSANFLIKNLKLKGKTISFDGRSTQKLNEEKSILKVDDKNNPIEFGQNTSRNIAEILAQAVDNLKDPIAGLINVNVVTLPIIITLLKSGATMEQALLLVNQPKFRRFSKEAMSLPKYKIPNLFKKYQANYNNEYTLVDFSSKELKEFNDSDGTVNTKRQEDIFRATLELYKISEEVTEVINISKLMDSGVMRTYAKVLVDYTRYMKYIKKGTKKPGGDNNFKYIDFDGFVPMVSNSIDKGLIEAKNLIDQKLIFSDDIFLNNILSIEETTLKPLNEDSITKLFRRLSTYAAVHTTKNGNELIYLDLPTDMINIYREEKDGKYKDFFAMFNIAVISNEEGVSKEILRLNKIDKDDRSILMTQWTEMAEDPEYYDIALKLASYQFFKSGYETLPGSFYEIMPIQFRTLFDVMPDQYVITEMIQRYPRDFVKTTKVKPIGNTLTLHVDDEIKFNNKTNWAQFALTYEAGVPTLWGYVNQKDVKDKPLFANYEKVPIKGFYGKGVEVPMWKDFNLPDPKVYSPDQAAINNIVETDATAYFAASTNDISQMPTNMESGVMPPTAEGFIEEDITGRGGFVGDSGFISADILFGVATPEEKKTLEDTEEDINCKDNKTE
jgi:hypothetical protein